MKKFSEAITQAALTVLTDHKVVYASQFADLLERTGAIQFSTKGNRTSQQGKGLFGGGVLASLVSQGYVRSGGHGEHYVVTEAGRMHRTKEGQ